ncbi:hypothetical protein PC110_g23520, partial [Phytophthora cactorum]
KTLTKEIKSVVDLHLELRRLQHWPGSCGDSEVVLCLVATARTRSVAASGAAGWLDFRRLLAECRVQAARAAARDGRKRAHLSRRGRLVCCCVERTREVADLVEPTKIVEAVRKKKTSLEDDGVDDSSKEITTYYSKHHNGADHVQRSGGALAATHGQSVVLAQLEAQFQ